MASSCLSMKRILSAYSAPMAVALQMKQGLNTKPTLSWEPSRKVLGPSVVLVRATIRCLTCCVMPCGPICSRHLHRPQPLLHPLKQCGFWRVNRSGGTAFVRIRAACSRASRRWVWRWAAMILARLSRSNAKTRFRRFKCGMRFWKRVFTLTLHCHQARRTACACCAARFLRRIHLRISTRSLMCLARW